MEITTKDEDIILKEVYETRWEYIKSDPDGARALLLLLKEGKGTADDFDTMVDRIIESRQKSAAACILKA